MTSRHARTPRHTNRWTLARKIADYFIPQVLPGRHTHWGQR